MSVIHFKSMHGYCASPMTPASWFGYGKREGTAKTEAGAKRIVRRWVREMIHGGAYAIYWQSPTVVTVWTRTLDGVMYRRDLAPEDYHGPKTPNGYRPVYLKDLAHEGLDLLDPEALPKHMRGF